MHSIAKGIVSLVSDFYFNRSLIDLYIAPSQFLASLLSKRYDEPGRVCVVKNPISGITHAYREKLDIITYFGRVSEEKNLQLLIKAIPYILEKRDVRVRIIGDGPDKSNLIKLAKKLKVVHSIEFTPFVRHSELSMQIADAKIYVLTSKFYETFSLVLYESIMAGLLPVVPAHGAIKDGVLWLNCGILYESENHVDLAQKILDAIQQYPVYQAQMEAAQKKIDTELTVQKYTARLLEIYQSMMCLS